MNPRLSRLLLMSEEFPGDPFFPYAIAMEYQASGDFSAAEAKLQGVIVEFPDYIPAYHLLAQILMQNHQRISEAIDVLQNGILLAEEKGEKKSAKEMKALLEDLME